MANKPRSNSNDRDNSLFSLTNHIKYGRLSSVQSNKGSSREMSSTQRLSQGSSDASKSAAVKQSERKSVDPPSGKRLTSPLKNIPNGITNSKKPRYSSECTLESNKITMTVNNNIVENPTAIDLHSAFEQKAKDEMTMDILKRFKTNFEQMTRRDLEQLVLEKIVEAIAHRSECADIKMQFDEHVKFMDGLRKKFESLQTEYENLHKIHRRLCVELDKHNDSVVNPMVCVRSIGLQVGRPHVQRELAKPEVPAFIDLTETLETSVADNGTSVMNDASKIATESSESANRTKMATGKENRKSSNGISEKDQRSDQTNKPSTMPNAAEEPEIIASTSNGHSSKSRKRSSPSASMPSTTATVASNISAASNSNNGMDINVVDLQPGTVQRHIPANIADAERNSGTRRNIPPLPPIKSVRSQPGWKRIPPRPIVIIDFEPANLQIKWDFEDSINGKLNSDYAEVALYEIYRLKQSNTEPFANAWKLLKTVKPQTLPIAAGIRQFGFTDRYYFAVRAVDEHNRTGMFSIPQTW